MAKVSVYHAAYVSAGRPAHERFEIYFALPYQDAETRHFVCNVESSSDLEAAINRQVDCIKRNILDGEEIQLVSQVPTGVYTGMLFATFPDKPNVERFCSNAHDVESFFSKVDPASIAELKVEPRICPDNCLEQIYRPLNDAELAGVKHLFSN